jgi:hypothetical protein
MPGAERRERHASPYDGASQSTSRFLQLFPDSPLAPLARGEVAPLDGFQYRRILATEL